jgi:Mg-chelatase subunit ChlD
MSSLLDRDLVHLRALLASLLLCACGQSDHTAADPPDGGSFAGTDGSTGASGGPPGVGGLDAGSSVGMPPSLVQPGVHIIGGEDACFSTVVDNKNIEPDVMIVLDRSSSMQQGNRWDPSKNAIKAITTQFEQKVDFGLTIFPGDDVDPCAAGHVNVPLQSKNAAAIGAAVESVAPVGFTPLGATLEGLASVLGDHQNQLDTIVKPAYVLLVTDGEPTCEADGLLITASPTSINRASTAIDRLKAQGVPTYVIGYNVADAAATMDQLAQHGGTEHYYAVENEQQLQEQFAKITAGLASCDFELDQVPDDPTRVKVVMDGRQINLNDALTQGWVLDGKTIKLQPGACQLIRDGESHNVAVTVECSYVPPG